MQPYKKAKLDTDPFEDDWDDDDAILELVAKDVPTSSQLSQAIKAMPINGTESTPAGAATKSRSFVFKRPSTSPNSVLSVKPMCYTSTPANQLSALSAALDSSVADSKQNTDSDVSSTHMSDMIRKQHAHEGEIKWLRAALKEKDNQVCAIRSKFSAERAKQRLEFSEKERMLGKEMESLRSELQFKESEMMSLSQTIDKLKREKSRPTQPSIALDRHGFPLTAAPLSTIPLPSQVLPIKQEVVNTSAAATADLKCDLLPVASDRLVARQLSTSKYKRGLFISSMLSDSHKVARGASDCIACVRDLCYL